MSLSSMILIALGLAMDAFAVSIVAGAQLGRPSGRQMFRLAWHFGFFQAMMPVLGWLAGRSVVGWIESWDHWVAFGLLALIGGKALFSALSGDEEEEQKSADPTRGMTMVALSVATSIDALAVGLSFAALRVSIILPVLLIGLVAGALTLLGICFGGRLGKMSGRWMEGIGGLVLIGIGTRILLEHLFFH